MRFKFEDFGQIRVWWSAASAVIGRWCVAFSRSMSFFARLGKNRSLLGQNLLFELRHLVLGKRREPHFALGPLVGDGGSEGSEIPLHDSPGRIDHLPPARHQHFAHACRVSTVLTDDGSVDFLGMLEPRWG
ncbi:MAG: hypothetical protein INR62_03460 [Rhodospirillales bacterium]|nr:hypothetical protein [Acetobacter sp.]